jgi:di/tricarboxylate transporter
LLSLDLFFQREFSEANTTVLILLKEQTTGKTGVVIFFHVLGMLVAISLFRNSGLFEIISNGLGFVFSNMGKIKKLLMLCLLLYCDRLVLRVHAVS